MKRIKLMIVDDEALVRTFIKTVVAREKLPVEIILETDNGLEAIKIASDNSPDLIFMDIRIPALDGLKAARAILKNNADIDIVMLTAYNDFEYARESLRIGARDYILKPIRSNEVVDIVQKAADSREDPIPSDSTSEEPELIFKTKKYILENLYNHLDLKSIAQALYISPFHLSRVFNRLTGMSIVDFILDARLYEAEKLLLQTNLSITEVAIHTGFNDSAYFSTCFKNKTGVTPGKYRKNNKQAETNKT